MTLVCLELLVQEVIITRLHRVAAGQLNGEFHCPVNPGPNEDESY